MIVANQAAPTSCLAKVDKSAIGACASHFSKQRCRSGDFYLGPRYNIADARAVMRYRQGGKP